MTTPAFTPVSERAFRDALRGLPTKREREPGIPDRWENVWIYYHRHAAVASRVDSLSNGMIIASRFYVRTP